MSIIFLPWRFKLKSSDDGGWSQRRPLSSSTDEAAVQLRSERMVPLSAFEPTHHEHSFPALLSIERFQATQSERVADDDPMCFFCRRLIREPTGRSQHGHSSTPSIALRILVRIIDLARAHLACYVAMPQLQRGVLP